MHGLPFLHISGAKVYEGEITMSSQRSINDRIKKITSLKPANWNLYRGMLRSAIKTMRILELPVVGPVMRRMGMLDPQPKALTQGYYLNLNVDITDKAESVIMPIDMMKQAIRESSYRIIMDKCICRSSSECKNFPSNHGCIFIGEGVRVCVENGVAREATIEEALAHVDRGAELGLVGLSVWIEIEQYAWGVKDEDMKRWLEFCFCCPCCCVGFKMGQGLKDKRIFQDHFRSIGWKAAVDPEACTRCRICLDVKCPVAAISANGDGPAVISAMDCVGCGICAARCPQKAITLKLAHPIKGTIKDYFRHGGLELDI